MPRFNCLPKCLLLIVLLVNLTALVAAQTEDAKIVHLRQQLALNYMQPMPHLALAKYYWQKGDRLRAFYISEYARRTRFPEAIFNQAFQISFGGAGQAGVGKSIGGTWLDDSRQNAAKATPTSDDKQATAIFDNAAALQKQGRLKQAEEMFVKAAENAPDSVVIQSWVGRFFLKVKADNERALGYYLNAYFLDPHAYETEFVESRIRKINWEAATARYNRLIASGVPTAKILEESNPTVVLMALEQMTVQWKGAYLKAVLGCMKHDDETVRWQATAAIIKNADRSFDETLQALLQDADLRRRGLAAYIAVHLWKRESFPVLRTMLSEEAQLLRFDAISAFVEGGGEEGFKIIVEHRRNETDPMLKQMIDKSLQRP